MFPYLERKAMDTVALANQQCGRDGAVNSAAHSKKNGGMIHSAGIVAGGMRQELEVGSPHLASMAGKIIGMLGCRRLLVNPFMSPHVTHPVEVGPVFY